MSQQEEKLPTVAPSIIKPVKFVFRECDSAPTFHVDGAWGTANNLGYIRIGFYTENPDTPRAIIQPVDESGTPSGEPSAVGSEDSDHYIVNRDFQCNVVLNLPTAIQVYQLLANYIQVVQQQSKEQMAAVQNQIKEAVAAQAPQTSK